MTSSVASNRSRTARRLKLRELQILSVVVDAGSMAKAAVRLSIAQPSVSEAIANIEGLLGVPLLDRSPRGIEPTIYAQALLCRLASVPGDPLPPRPSPEREGRHRDPPGVGGFMAPGVLLTTEHATALPVCHNLPNDEAS